MLNFTVGPVTSTSSILAISCESSPYFRTSDFSNVMLESERLFLDLLNAPKDSRAVFLTASGTGAMEAAVMGVLSPGEHVAVVNGGGFGERFCQLSRLHGHDVFEARLPFGGQVERVALERAIESGSTALLVNMCETSSGVLYDMEEVSRCCKEHGVLLVVDAVSAFVADPIDMAALGADVVLTGSQKALACHPGVSVLALSPKAQERVWSNPECCMYLSLREALLNGLRGQTPWTPAVTTLLEVRERLAEIECRGIEAERATIISRATRVRDALASTELSLVAEDPSNCVSAFWCPSGNAADIVNTALREHGMWLCPNGGKQAESVFRIGHIGDIDEGAMDALVGALNAMHGTGLF